MKDPTPVDPSDFRTVFAHLPTGVAVITSNGPDGPLGMAVNSVTSVSLDPPLVLFCAARSSSTWPGIRDSGAFCVNIMARHHEEITRRFAARAVDRFAGIAHEDRSTGPALRDAVAWIECRIEAEHPGGDHTIVLARVVALEAAAGLVEPLVFFKGDYGSFVRVRRG